MVSSLLDRFFYTTSRYSTSLRWVWLALSYLVRAKRTTSATTASGVALGGLRPLLPVKWTPTSCSIYTCRCEDAISRRLPCVLR